MSKIVLGEMGKCGLYNVKCSDFNIKYYIHNDIFTFKFIFINNFPLYHSTFLFLDLKKKKSNREKSISLFQNMPVHSYTLGGFCKTWGALRSLASLSVSDLMCIHSVYIFCEGIA